MFYYDYTTYDLLQLNKNNCDNYGNNDSHKIYLEHSPGVFLQDAKEGFDIWNKDSLYLTWGEDVAEQVNNMGYNAIATGSVMMNLINKTKDGTRCVYIPNHPGGDGKYLFPLLHETMLINICNRYAPTTKPLISSIDVHGSDIIKNYPNCDIIHSHRSQGPIEHIDKHELLINEAKCVILDDHNTFYYVAEYF
jgi:hypothetical protein